MEQKGVGASSNTNKELAMAELGRRHMINYQKASIRYTVWPRSGILPRPMLDAHRMAFNEGSVGRYIRHPTNARI